MIFITNAPYPADAVQRFLDRLGVRRDAYDAIISSGDVTRSVVETRLAQHVFHLGPPRDLPIFAGLKVAFAPVESADYVVCSGLFDDRTETPENYRDMLAFMRGRSLFMVCANPDAVVERGDTLVYCAGALADAYVALGGEALYCGKPHAPIYEAALCKAAAFRGGEVPPLARVLAIGDSVKTDLKGAAAFGVDCLFVISGLHADQFGLREAPDRSGSVRGCRRRAQVGHSPTCVVIRAANFRALIAYAYEADACPLLPRIPKRHRVFQKLHFGNAASAAFAIERWPARAAIVSSNRLLLAVIGA